MLVPPSGHVAGIYARVDVERGMHQAPANEVVRGIVTRGLQLGQEPLSHTLNKSQQEVLNPRGINVIRDFRPESRGIRVWGARTMSSDAEWKYVNVRRLFIFLEQSIERGTQWVASEPNTERTWLVVRTAIGNFLTTVWRNGALMGSRPEEAFFVTCDRTTMTQTDIDSGRLICEIGIALVRPAEFVIFRIGQKTMEAGG
jgi:phage tail sheath protein FI